MALIERYEFNINTRTPAAAFSSLPNKHTAPRPNPSNCDSRTTSKNDPVGDLVGTWKSLRQRLSDHK